MNARTLFGIAAATMLLVGGVAAVGAASPADVSNPNDDASDGANPSATDEGDAAAADDAQNDDARNDAADRATAVGPNGGFSERVPDHVSRIHETIESFLGGERDDLGPALSDFLSASDGADAADDDTRSAGA